MHGYDYIREAVCRCHSTDVYMVQPAGEFGRLAKVKLFSELTVYQGRRMDGGMALYGFGCTEI